MASNLVNPVTFWITNIRYECFAPESIYLGGPMMLCNGEQNKLSLSLLLHVENFAARITSDTLTYYKRLMLKPCFVYN